MKIFATILSLIIINACSSSKASFSTTTENKVPSGKYTVSQINDLSGFSEDLLVTFNDNQKTISGFSGCNTFTGNYTLENNIIKISELISTEKACLEDSKNIAEKQFLLALQQANAFRVDDGHIILTSKNKTPLLTMSNIKTSSKITQEPSYIIEYSAITRGFYYMLKLNKDSISVQKAHGKDSRLKKISFEDYQSISSKIKALNLNELSQLKAPSTAHQYDGAAIGSLKITFEGKTYQTPSFDHGNPPKTIKTLVDELLSLSEKVE